MEKKTSPANKLVLKRILAQDGNGRCADCKTASHPRWASWNLGILICIRCSGIHRSLGTHISKVRSIDLDTWNDIQLEKLVELGNTRANAYWESKLPANYVPDESKIVNFIKTKYELKRWIPDDDAPLKASMGSSASRSAPNLPPKVRTSAGGPSLASPPPTSSSSADLLNLDGAFNLGPAQRSQPQAQPATGQHTRDLFSLHQPAAQASPAQPAVSNTASSTQAARADVKKSILSLYATTPPPQPTPVRPAQSQQPSLAAGYRTTAPSSQPARRPDPEAEEDNFASVWN